MKSRRREFLKKAGCSIAGACLGCAERLLAEETNLAEGVKVEDSKLIIDLNEDPAKIKEMTTTPGGTTIEAIYQIEQSQIRSAMIRAIEEATKKSQTIREKLKFT